MMIRYVRHAKRKALGGAVLLRLDFNTADDWRLRAVLPTVRLLSRYAGKIIIASHRGRPRAGVLKDGTPKFLEKGLGLRRNARKLGNALRRRVRFIPHFNLRHIRRDVARAPRGSLFLLENIRYVPGETENSARVARALASLADYYVNDAFAVSHRANASVAAITRFLPSYAGLEFEKEITFLSKVMEQPRRPLVFVLGGSKPRDKLGVISRFTRAADFFLLGGAAANTMLLLKGMNVGNSVVEKDRAELRELREFLLMKNLVMPIDFRWSEGAILDIGPETGAAYADILQRARTIIWSGPMGLIEKAAYTRGSVAVAKAIARNAHAFSVVGGGETVMFLKKRRLDGKFSFVSAGGGAMLDFLAGKKLPGIEALKKSSVS